MANDYVLTCCSTCDLGDERLAERGIRKAYFHVIIGNDDFYDNIGVSITQEQMYKRILSGEEGHSSQVSTAQYLELFEPILAEGKDILHLTLASGISGTINSAQVAKATLAEKYPDRKMYIVDSASATGGFGVLMEILADMRDEGKSIDELYEWVEANKLRQNLWFFVSDLTFLIRGGRVSKTSGTLGNLLNICPVMRLNPDSVIEVMEKVRGKKKVARRIVDIMAERAENGTDYDGYCIINHSSPEEAEITRAMIEETFPKLKGKVIVRLLGGTIGLHTGPGAVVLSYMGKERDPSTTS